VTLARLVFRLRPEEAVALAFLLPTSWLTLAAFFYAREAGVLGPRYPGGVARLAAVLVLLAGLALALRRFPASGLVRSLRETVPLFACLLIYTNLHDTIGFVNPNDVHQRLVALDASIFGVQPCVWAERFITPALTELMQFLYLNFFWIAPSTSVVLLLQGRWPEFRAATTGVLTCFFLGYALYVVFPAAPPRLVLASEFTKNLRGYPVGFSSLSAEAFALLPTDSRAALRAALVLCPAAVRGRALDLDDLPAPPLLRGPGRRLGARPARGVDGAADRRVVGAEAARTRLRASPGSQGTRWTKTARIGLTPADGSRQAGVRPRRYFAGSTSVDQA
jgi:hypothetical protein